MSTVPYIFAGDTGNIPLSNLDDNFANVKSAADFVIANVQANITQVGRLNGLNVLGEARADFFVGNGSLLTGVTGTVVGVLPSLEVSGQISTGNLEAETTIKAFGNITSVENIISLERIIAVGNVSGNYILGNGRALTGILYNANSLTGDTLANNIVNSSLTSVGVLSNLSVSGTVTGNIQSDSIAVSNITVSNNATAGFFIGDGSQLTNVVANTLGNITSINVPGNIVGGNLLSNGNLVIGGNARALGNIQGTFFIGNGSQLTGVTNYTNANVVTLLASFGSNSVSTSGNITAGRLFGNGSNITGLYSNANVINLMANFGTNPISTTGNVTGGNLSADFAVFDRLDVAGNITGDFFLTNGVTGNTASFTGNVTVGNLITATAGTPTIRSTGNLVLIANGVVQVTSPLNANSTISATGNIATGQFFVGNLVGNISSSSNLVLSAAGEVQISELSVASTIFATGNIVTDGFFVGNFVNVSGGNLNITGNIIDTGPLTIFTGSNGNIALVPNGTGIVTTTSAVSVAGNVTAGNITARNVVGSGVGTFRLPNLTAPQIANIVAANGDLIYNTTVNKIQGFENGAWGNLI